MLDPGREIAQRLEELGLTQKALSLQIGKKVSEINELIKGKRKITLAWDYLLAGVFHTPQKYWIHKQIDMDYAKMLEERREQQENIPVNQPSISSQQPRSADQQ
ncbi:MAG: helix-turn-helix transcriptional regulator [bacterium]|nr:helix-turn-helix transcriptional regulator [bacterium]